MKANAAVKKAPKAFYTFRRIVGILFFFVQNIKYMGELFIWERINIKKDEEIILNHFPITKKGNIECS